MPSTPTAWRRRGRAPLAGLAGPGPPCLACFPPPAWRRSPEGRAGIRTRSARPLRRPPHIAAVPCGSTSATTSTTPGQLVGHRQRHGESRLPPNPPFCDTIATVVIMLTIVACYHAARHPSPPPAVTSARIAPARARAGPEGPGAGPRRRAARREAGGVCGARRAAAVRL